MYDSEKTTADVLLQKVYTHRKKKKKQSAIGEMVLFSSVYLKEIFPNSRWLDDRLRCAMYIDSFTGRSRGQLYKPFKQDVATTSFSIKGAYLTKIY